MKIISKYKDYYDYLVHLYGEDEKVVYNRGDISVKGSNVSIPSTFHSEKLSLPIFVDHKDRLFMNFGDPKSKWRNDSIINCWLVVVGKVYPLIEKTEDAIVRYEILDGEKHKKLGKFFKRKYFYPEYDSPVTEVGQHFWWVDEICKELDSPVFIMKDVVCYQRSLECTVKNRYFPLKDIEGFVSLYSPEQIYQDINHYILNTMRESPDYMPPGNPAQTNEEKIVSHGFDKKISFRHR